MSFSCQFCSNFPRHPCRDKEEAGTCPNATPGQWFNFNPQHVADWIRYQASGDEELLEAAALIEKKMY